MSRTQSSTTLLAAKRDEASAWPSEGYGWYVVFILCICGVVGFIDRQIINLLVEDIKADLQITDTQVSLLQGLAFALFYAVMAVPLGRLADTSNRRWIITAGIVVWSAAAAACGLARSFWQLFVARMMVGVGEATLTPSGFSMLADLFRPQRLSLPLSVFTASSFAGSGVAGLAGGFIIAQLAKAETISLPLLGAMKMWEAAFVIAALPGFVVALVFWLTIREPQRRASVRSITTTHAADKPKLAEVLAFCRSYASVFTAVFGGISLLAAVQFSLGAWVPAFFMRNYGWMPSEIGYAYGLVFLICGTGGVLSGGFLAYLFQSRGHRDGHLRTALLSALITLPFVVALPFVGSAYASLAMLAPAVFFGTMAFGAGPALIPVISPPRMRGLLVAMYLLIANILGQAGGPWIIAMFTDYVFGDPRLVGYSLATACSILLVLGAWLIWSGFAGLRQFTFVTAEAQKA
jgi:MFS family permease